MSLKFKIAGSFIKTVYKSNQALSRYLAIQHPITCIEITYPADVWLDKKEQSFILYTSQELGYSINTDDWYPSAMKALEDYRGMKPPYEWRYSIASGLQEFMEMSSPSQE